MYVIADHTNHHETKLLTQNITSEKTYYLYLNEKEFHIFQQHQADPQSVKLIAFHTKLATKRFIQTHRIAHPEIIQI